MLLPNIDQYSVNITTVTEAADDNPFSHTPKGLGGLSALGGIEIGDVLVDEPQTNSDSEMTGFGTAPAKTVKPGSATQVCSYEELAENNLSDCSLEDFEAIFDSPDRRQSSATNGTATKKGGSRTRRVAGANPNEKRSLLIDDGAMLVE